jgi:BioD-like phosphotransacetylase family protein
MRVRFIPQVDKNKEARDTGGVAHVTMTASPAPRGLEHHRETATGAIVTVAERNSMNVGYLALH